jgi:trehalose 6-phosphate phosphatase
VEAVSGVHGLERRDGAGRLHRASPPPAARPGAFGLSGLRARAPGVVLEDKGLGVVLHYRAAPEMEAAIARFGGATGARLGLHAQPGSMMFELPDARRAARARPCAPIWPSRRSRAPGPVFVGDDLTDEDGFEAAEALGGFGVIVGPREPTAARFRLPDVAGVRAWLAAPARKDAAA